eukprot:TRINITY_DN102_c0_g1_i1.p1 TRINITY_DN102_c0_g1~~TRINITY_DN102_c0_g1_i1.p1  ORF type:complete len:328 (-),score=45.02 TRINITY_DN102_c0_g1_i1:37-1020(-)
MKIFGALIVLLCIVFVATASSCSKDDFESFKDKFARTYYDDAEESRRYENFCNTIKKNEDLAKKYPSAKWGVTQFADWTDEEFKAILGAKAVDPTKVFHNSTLPRSINSGSAPSSYNWQDYSTDVVTPVYNQAQCGSCWAFSATEQIESMWALAGNALTELSMQQVTSCDPYSDGCGGGNPSNAYTYVMQFGGIESYSAYPYVDQAGVTTPCDANKAYIAATINGWSWTSTSPSTESDMVQSLYSNGPVSVCVDASNWSSYTGGLYPASACGTAIDHCVEAEGYDLNNGYWWIRNSWATSWGISGYMQLQYGANACGVAQQATQVTI